jgi:hypothetical protein
MEQAYYEIEDILYFRDKLEDMLLSANVDDSYVIEDIIREFDKHFKINQ